MTVDRDDIDVRVDKLQAAVATIFHKAGCPETEAHVIAGELVRADQMGIHSHGATRVPEYIAAVGSGHVIPGGKYTVVRELGGTVLVDGGKNYGQVVGQFALNFAIDTVRTQGTVCLVTRNSYHLGRVGALAEHAAEHDLICIATVAVGLPGVVAAWGGAEAVLGTNPFAYGVPLDDGIVVTDFATSTSAEGAIRLAARSGRTLPEGVLVDGAGEATTDPAALFRDPRGAILPFGGAQGYKGYALNLLPELVAAALAGYGPHDPTRPSNCLFLMLIDPTAFLPADTFKQLAGESARMVKASRPRPGQTVLLPGEPERQALARNEVRVRLPAATLDGIRRTAQSLAVNIDL